MSPVSLLVIPTNEELEIALQTVSCIHDTSLTPLYE
jgi:acetate kinase